MASWHPDLHDDLRDHRRDESYTKPDSETPEEADLRLLVEAERVRRATTGGVAKK